MKFVSVCAGIEAASVAWHPLGWEAVLLSEIEPFPRAVLAHHYPNTPLHGDFTTLIADPPKADLLVGGTPCQAFSVAGKRLSLEDYRGNLSLAFADLALAGQYRWVVWENVPGVLSTKDNAFGCFLGRLAGDESPVEPPGGKWDDAGLVVGPTYTCAWRVLDAQYFGVAQRRKRVFVLARRGAGHGAAPAALFPVGPSVRGYPAPRRETREGPATDVAGRAGSREWPAEVAPTLYAQYGAKQGMENQHAFGGAGLFVQSPTVMRQREGKDGGGKGPLLAANVSLTLAAGNDQTLFAVPLNTQVGLRAHKEGDGTGLGAGEDGDPAFTLQSAHHHGVFSLTTEQTPKFAVDLAQTVTKGSPSGGGHPQAVVAAFDERNITSKTNRTRVEPGLPVPSADSAPMSVIAPTLSASNDPSRSPQSSEVTAQVEAVASLGLRPRRLTPTECEKLQGFPVGYTNVPWRKGESPDSLRYRALGNSMAIPVVAWIGRRIQMVIDAGMDNG